MNRLFNMSVPPKTNITIEIKQVSNYIVFDPNVLCELLNCKKEELINSISKYIIDNPSYIDASPNSYLFALRNDKYENYSYSVCKDINFLLCIFSKTTNNIYIPNRKPVFTNEKFVDSLLFMESEILDGKQ